MLDLLLWGGAATLVKRSIDKERAERQLMETWSIQKLHAYAGVKSHPKALKEHAYHLAKKKKFDSL